MPKVRFVCFKRENPIHEKQLLLLWKCSKTGAELEERKSLQWKSLGFQGKDPATDFRGGGFFALRNLLYFAQNYESRYLKFLQGRDYHEHFPVALTGLNLTMMLYELLGWGMLRREPTTSEGKTAKRNLIHFLFVESPVRPSPEGEQHGETAAHTTFHELYCLLFDMFEKEWKRRNATTLDFSEVIKTTRQKLESLLASSSSFQQLKVAHQKYLRS
jgi:hypothetical protein